MSNDIDTDLRRLFAESREEIQDVGFTAQSAKLIARQRNIQRLGAAAMVVLIGIVAAALAPVLSEATQFIGASSLALSGVDEFTMMAIAWGTAALAGFYALVWARP